MGNYETSNKAWSTNQLAAMTRNGKITFNNIVQRALVWNKVKKSELIHSLIIGMPVPSVYANRLDDGSGKKNPYYYDILDGKQRLSTIAAFINNEFALAKIPLMNNVTYYNDMTGQEETVDIADMHFEELPEGVQEKVKNARLSVIYFDELSHEQTKLVFKRLNNGQNLTTKSRALASCKNIEDLLNIGEHPVFEEMLTNKARDNKNQAIIVMKCWTMLYKNMDEISFASKDFNPMLESVEIADEEKLTLTEIFNLMSSTHATLMEMKEKRVARKLYTETHFVSLIPFFKDAVENGYDREIIANWLVTFFKVDEGVSISEDYNNAASAGSAKNDSINTRNNELSDSYSEFFGNPENLETNIDDSDYDDEESSEDITGEIMDDMEDSVE